MKDYLQSEINDLISQELKTFIGSPINEHTVITINAVITNVVKKYSELTGFPLSAPSVYIHGNEIGIVWDKD